MWSCDFIGVGAKKRRGGRQKRRKSARKRQRKDVKGRAEAEGLNGRGDGKLPSGTGTDWRTTLTAYICLWHACSAITPMHYYAAYPYQNAAAHTTTLRFTLLTTRHYLLPSPFLAAATAWFPAKPLPYVCGHYNGSALPLNIVLSGHGMATSCRTEHAHNYNCHFFFLFTELAEHYLGVPPTDHTSSHNSTLLPPTFRAHAASTHTTRVAPCR